MKKFFYIIVFGFFLCDAVGQSIVDIEMMEKCWTKTNGDKLSYVEYKTVYNTNNVTTFSIICEDASGNTITCPTSGTIGFGFCVDDSDVIEQCWAAMDSVNYCEYFLGCETSPIHINQVTGTLYRPERKTTEVYVNGLLANLPNYPYTQECPNEQYNIDLRNYLEGQGYDVKTADFNKIEVANSSLDVEIRGIIYLVFLDTGLNFIGYGDTSTTNKNYELTNSCDTTINYTYYDVCLDKKTGTLMYVLDENNNNVTLPANAKKIPCPVTVDNKVEVSLGDQPISITTNNTIDVSENCELIRNQSDDQFIVGLSSYTIPASSINSYCFLVVEGTATYTRNGNTSFELPVSYRKKENAKGCEYLDFELTITGTSANSKIELTTIK